MTEISSVSGHTWRERPHNARDALAITQQLGLPDIIGRILAGRNIAPHEAEGFLQPTLREFLPDPFHLKDMEKAARRVAEEIVAGCRLQVAGKEEGARICGGVLYDDPTGEVSRSGTGGSVPPMQNSSIAIFGDYDVDGATSSALLVRYFRAFGIEPLVHIPDRIKEGYGPNASALLSLKERGAKLVITVDCGTAAFEPLAKAREAGMEVIVVDHHKGDVRMPECYALVNPNRCDEASPHTQLAACGVTFLLLVAVNRVLKESAGCRLQPLPDLLPLLDIVALGTICDVVPLTGVNRALVAQGLKIMGRRGNAGIAAAMDVAKLTEKPAAYHAGFVVGPRINAGGRVGRVGRPDLGVRLLTTDDAFEARILAEELDRFNGERKAIEAQVQEEAMRDAETLPASDAVILIAGNSWHPGVIGIVAGRLKEHFNKPVAVIALKDGIGKASARSISGIDLGAAVIAANHEGLLLGGGGHAMAAGFTVAEENIVSLRAFFNRRLADAVGALAREKILHIDGLVSLQGVTAELAHLIEKAGPFGSGNHSARLCLRNVRVVRTDIVGDGHVRAIVTDAGAGAGSAGLKTMAFRSMEKPVGQALLNARGKCMHLCGQVKINAWQGRETVDFLIDDVAYAV
jgi:single-stranded-DNA-specific exonuclease